MKISPTTTGVALTVTLLALTGCTDNTASNSADGAVTVSSTESECNLSTTEVKAGKKYLLSH